MTAAQYRSALAQLGLTPTAAARLLGIDERTSRRYARQGVRGPADLLIRLVLTKRVTATDINFARRYRSL
jgi:hypothetical protein